MSVVNCRVSHIRPKYQNLKDWCSDPDNVYIGRKGIVFIDGKRYPKEDSIFCNPYKVGRDGNREEVLNKYLEYLKIKIKDINFVTQLKKLKNKNLGCWCKPDDCHGDILLKLISEL